jgi:hypothetical protein
VEVFRGAAAPGRRELIESILRDDGIPYVIKSPGGIAEHPLTVGPMAEFIVLVPDEYSARASVLVEAADEIAPDLDDGHDDEEQFSGGILRRMNSPPTMTDRLIFRSFAVVAGAGGLALILVDWSRYFAIGFLLIVILSPLLWAASNRG